MTPVSAPPPWLLALPGLDNGAKLVLLCLRSWGPFDTDETDVWVYPSNESISHRLGMPESTVHSALYRLKKNGLIRRESRRVERCDGRVMAGWRLADRADAEAICARLAEERTQRVSTRARKGTRGNDEFSREHFPRKQTDVSTEMNSGSHENPDSFSRNHITCTEPVVKTCTLTCTGSSGENSADGEVQDEPEPEAAPTTRDPPEQFALSVIDAAAPPRDPVAEVVEFYREQVRAVREWAGMPAPTGAGNASKAHRKLIKARLAEVDGSIDDKIAAGRKVIEVQVHQALSEPRPRDAATLKAFRGDYGWRSLKIDTLFTEKNFSRWLGRWEADGQHELWGNTSRAGGKWRDSDYGASERCPSGANDAELRLAAAMRPNKYGFLTQEELDEVPF